MKPILPAVLAWLTLIGAAVGAPLDPVILDEALWTKTPDAFMEASKDLGFTWTSAAHDSARAAEKEMTAFGLPTAECIARFDGETLKEITVVFYARGDAGDLSEEKYNALIQASCEALTKAAGINFTVRGKDPGSVVKAEGLIWATSARRYLLEYSKVREVKSMRIPFRAEFVRLEITPPEKKTGLVAQVREPSNKNRFSGVEHVKKNAATGDEWIPDVPMVDQGEKGYCVVAATERVIRYYGGSVDANELAQVANSSAAEGTSFQAMFEALKKLSARMKVKVREIEKTDLKDILKLMADYNREAKKRKVALIPEPGPFTDLKEIYQAMNVDVLRDVRTKNVADLSRFQRSISDHIDKGIPLLWTVMLGKIPEAGIPPDAGGHMRLIIGYNSKTTEVLYSDTWGAGHELKRMPLADAWTMTTGTMSIEPVGT